jgi:hypothetical protein
VVEVQVTEDHPQYTNWLPVLQFHHRFRPSDSTSSKLRNCIALRIVPQSFEEPVAQSDHCIVLIDQYVANGGSHVFRNVGSSQQCSAPLSGAGKASDSNALVRRVTLHHPDLQIIGRPIDRPKPPAPGSLQCALKIARQLATGLRSLRGPDVAHRVVVAVPSNKSMVVPICATIGMHF